MSLMSYICPVYELMKNIEKRLQYKLCQDDQTCDGNGSILESTELEKENEESLMDDNRSQWLEMCFTSLAVLISTILRKVSTKVSNLIIFRFVYFCVTLPLHICYCRM